MLHLHHVGCRARHIRANVSPIRIFKQIQCGFSDLNENLGESKYERKTPLEHVLLRPGMYVGQVECTKADVWVFDPKKNNGNGQMLKKKVEYSPALLKIFDEILVNAADNRHRGGKKNEMNHIDINVDCNTSEHNMCITITNNGAGIPMSMHATEKMYTPELIFGHLLTGSNFDDQSESITGGRHGYGAKLTNIFSNRFEVELYNSDKSTLYTQTWGNNMNTVSPPVIQKKYTPPPSCSPSAMEGSYTRITFVPDMKRFNTKITHFDDLVDLFKRRSLDIAAAINSDTVKTTFNGEVLLGEKPEGLTAFESYARLFCDEKLIQESDFQTESPVFYHRINKHWEVALIPSRYVTRSGQFDTMCFVNCVHTRHGGSHVNYISDQIIECFSENVKKQFGTGSGVSITSNMIRNKYMLFVNCNVDSPTFDSQSKDTLTTPSTMFNSQSSSKYACKKLPKVYQNRLLKESGIMEELLHECKIKESSKLTKSIKIKGGNIKNKLYMEVPKLDDAQFAGDPNKSTQCSLILTEGDSAKALAIAGLEVVGREYYGVLPLRGKILNVRDVAKDKLRKNEEITALCKVIGLDFDNTYENGIENQGLRYGSIILMTDQDHDGSHIKGLIINFFHHFWPNLLKVEGFLQHFITPLVKVKTRSRKRDVKGVNGSATEVHSFYSIPQYNEWVRALESSDTVTNILETKYYKGLGTNTAKEGREYFKFKDKHVKPFSVERFTANSPSSPLSEHENMVPYRNSKAFIDSIDLSFNKSRADDRRLWLQEGYDPNLYLDPTAPTVSYDDFVDQELIHFSHTDNIRSIPSAIDGLKPAQRKVLYACFKKGLIASSANDTRGEMKVAQLAGYVAEQTAYHHGEASLTSTIVKMAQNYVGSNNLPLLVPSGQFGTRSLGGHDHASPRYIYTKLSHLAPLVFPQADELLLDYATDDGKVIEPVFYIPIIPMLLVNGSQGIGTGWSTKVPCYNPIDLANFLEYVLTRPAAEGIDDWVDEAAREVPLTPWCRGFKGTIKESIKKGPNDTIQYETSGVVTNSNRKSARSGNVAVITELPIGMWTSDYKEFLIKSAANGDIQGFTELHTTDQVHFEVFLNGGSQVSCK